MSNKIYIDCFFYGFFIEKHELLKYKNVNNQIYIHNLIQNQINNNLFNKLIKNFHNL